MADRPQDQTVYCPSREEVQAEDERRRQVSETDHYREFMRQADKDCSGDYELMMVADCDYLGHYFLAGYVEGRKDCEYCGVVNYFRFFDD